ncbi:MAG: hypothetical protein JNL43_15210 [Flavobacteriales bacterium]|nr:hypothetical protein [Flavobacteriales bacterium]
MASSTSSSDRGPARLLLRTLLFAVPIALVLLLAMAFGPHASRIDFMGGLIAKHARLKSLGSPKVVVIGGSNAAFGIDSEILERALCKPVVNMSIHASLGFRFMVDEVKGSLGDGDLVIAALEHSAYSKPEKDNDIHILTVDRWPEALDLLPWYRRPRILLGVMVMRAQGAWKIFTGAWKDDSPDPVYRADGFNERGDLITHLDRPPRGPGRQQHVDYHLPLVGDTFHKVARELVDSAAVHHAHVVFAWPAIARTSYRPEFHQAIRAGTREHGFDMIGVSEDYVMPDTSFYDTHHHLRAAGRRFRTERMVRDLCASGLVTCCLTNGDTL